MPLLKKGYVFYVLLYFACCSGTRGLGAVLLPNQPTPAALVASLQDCPATATVDPEYAYHSSSCAFLAPNSSVTLQPGPPATLPLHTTLIGGPDTGPLQPACCANSTSTPHVPFPPQRSIATTINSTATSLPQLDLSRLASSSLVVPPNGTLSLHNLALTTAQLPTAPYPLPAASYLSLLAIRLSPGARLQLSSVTITTPSCVSLALHQDLACRAAPTPNFTVTPISLVVDSYNTAYLSADGVLLTCSGRQLPAPCIAEVKHAGEEILDSIRAWEESPADSTLPVPPLYLWVQATVRLSRPPAAGNAENPNGSSSSSSSSSAAADSSGFDSQLPDRSVQHITRGTVVLGGPPDRSSVLEMSDSSSLFSIQDAGLVRLQHLTLRGLPLGPPERYPEALLRLPMWFAPALRIILGAGRGAKLDMRNVTVELPPEEMAFWRSARTPDYEPLVQSAGLGQDTVTNSSSSGIEVSDGACVTDDGQVFEVQQLVLVQNCSSCLLLRRFANRGGSLDIQDTLLTEASYDSALRQPPKQWQQQPARQGSAPEQQGSRSVCDSVPAGWQDHQETQDAGHGPGGGLPCWLPAAPSSPLCSLAAGPGAQEVIGLDNMISKVFLDAEYGSDSVGAVPLQVLLAHVQRALLSPPSLSNIKISPYAATLDPFDLSRTLQPLAVSYYCTVLQADTRLDDRNAYNDLYNYLRQQSVIEIPGTLLLGDPVAVRTLDLAGLPSTVVLEREPLTRAPSTWPRPDVLLPFLDTVQQQRQAAGLRGLLTEPVSLTVRHLVLINLPAAGPFVRVANPPAPIWAQNPPERGASGGGGVGRRRRTLMAHVDRHTLSRGLRQAPRSVEGGAQAGAAQAEGGANPNADYLGGLHPSLANLTSCVWSLQLDRAAVVRAVRGRLQQEATGGGRGGGNSSSSSTGGGVQSPVDVPYVLLQSVQLVVPERELLLLAWAWATNATRHAAHPGLAEQLQLMLDGSRLAGGAEAALQQLLHGPTDSHSRSPPALPAGLRLVFDQFVWCELLGTNVTLTSQLPGPTPLSLQLPDLDLAVAYGTGGPDDVEKGAPGRQQGGEDAAPLVVGGPPVVVLGPLSPGAGAGDPAGGGLGAPAAVERPVGQGPTRAGAGPSVPPDPGTDSAQQPLATDGGGGGSSSRPPLLGLAVGLAVGCAAIIVGACVGVVLLMRRKRGAREPDKVDPDVGIVPAGCGVGAGAVPCHGASEEQVRASKGGRHGTDAGAHSSSVQQQGSSHSALSHQQQSVVQQHGSSPSTLSHQQQSVVQEQSPASSMGGALSPRAPSWVLRRMAELRLNVERKRQLVLGQVQQQQQHQKQPQADSPYTESAGVSTEPRLVQKPLQQQASGNACQLSSGQERSSSTFGANTGVGSSASVPSAVYSGTRNEHDGSLSLDLAAASCSGGGTETMAAAETTNGFFMGGVAAASAMAGRYIGTMAAGGGSGCSNSGNNSSSSGGSGSSGGSSGPPLVLLRELGRGAQGVVYAGRWRGLDVAVKSVLVQRLGGSRTGGATWHGPSLHSALAEGSISSAMSHPHVVATYATYVQGPEGEAQVGRQQGERQAPEEAGPGGDAAGSPDMLWCQSATGAAALETIRGSHEPQSGEGLRTVALVGSSSSARAERAGQQMTCQEVQHSTDAVQQQSGVERLEATQIALRQSAQLPTPGAPAVASAQVQVWKLTLVQELCTGGSLRDSLLAGRLARRGGGPWPRALHPAAALRLALHVARGSAHLHRHGVLWNDLSSANVLLQLGRRGGAGGEAADGGGSSDSSGALDFVAKVADFGLSRRLPEGATHASETAGRSGLYVAPEVVRYGRCTPASDVYAYGVLLWEVAAGVPLPELLSQPEGGAVRSWLAQQAFVPPEEAEALPVELLTWPGAGQRRGSWGPAGAADGGGDTEVDGIGGLPLPAGYVALAVQCLRQDPQQRPSFEDACLWLDRVVGGFGAK